jgi:hypothetical protein
MATIDEQIQVANKLAQSLSIVSRNEWMHWLQIAEKYELNHAIEWADKLSQDVTIRSNIQQANRSIAHVMRSNQKLLQNFSPQECWETLGYVGRFLKIAEKEPSNQQRKTPRKQRKR